MIVYLLIWAISYFSTYVILRNRGIREMRQYSSEGILYDSVECVTRTHDLRLHYFWCHVFAPLNYLDQQLLGGPGPIRGILFDIS